VKPPVALIVASLAVTGGLVSAPTAAAGEVRPDIPITKAFGQRYLKLVCPTNRNLAASRKAWNKAFGQYKPKRPPSGPQCPTTSGSRVAICRSWLDETPAG
jgi:hypothetical protein